MQPAVRSIVTVLLLASLASGAPARAEMLPSNDLPTNRSEQLADQRSELRARLEAHGVGSSEAQARVASLTDAEVSQLAGGFDQLPAGRGDPRGIVAVIMVGAMVYVVIKLLPFFIIGGAAVIAAKSANKNPA